MDHLFLICLHFLGPTLVLCINLNPFASFSGMTFEPAADYSVNQGGIFASPHINLQTGSLYPFLTEDHVAKAFGMNGNTGIKYPVVPFAGPSPDASGLRPATLRQRGPPAPNLGRGKFPPGGRQRGPHPNNQNEYNIHHQRNNGGNHVRQGLRDVTLDIRGGGYKIERPRNTRPYKPPSAEASNIELRGQMTSNRNGAKENRPRPRNRRPNGPPRQRAPSSRNPYYNDKQEMSRPPMIPTVEFESPENVLPFNPKLYKHMQEMMKFGPRFQQDNSRGAYVPSTYTGGMGQSGGSSNSLRPSPNIPPYQDRNIQDVTHSTYNNINSPYTLVPAEKLVDSYGAFQQPQTENPLDSPVSYAYYQQDPKTNPSVSQAQNGQETFRNIPPGYQEANVQSYGNNGNTYYQTQALKQAPNGANFNGQGNAYINSYAVESFPSSNFPTVDQSNYYANGQQATGSSVTHPPDYGHSTTNPALDYKQLMQYNQQKNYGVNPASPSPYQDTSKLSYPTKLAYENPHESADLPYRAYSGNKHRHITTESNNSPLKPNSYTHGRDTIPPYANSYSHQTYNAPQQGNVYQQSNVRAKQQDYGISPYQIKQSASPSGGELNSNYPSYGVHDQTNYGSAYSLPPYAYQDTTAGYNPTPLSHDNEYQYHSENYKSKQTSIYPPSKELYYQQSANNLLTARPDYTTNTLTPAMTTTTTVKPPTTIADNVRKHEDEYDSMKHEDEQSSGSEIAALHLSEPESVILPEHDHGRYFYQHENDKVPSTTHRSKDITTNSSSSSVREAIISKPDVTKDRRQTPRPLTTTSTPMPKVSARKTTPQHTGYSVHYRTVSRRNRVTTPPTDKTPTTRAPKYTLTYSYHFTPKKTSAANRTTATSPIVTDTETEASEPPKYHDPVPAYQATDQPVTIINIVTATDTATPTEASVTVAAKHDQNKVPVCALRSNSTYCLHDPEYPKELIKDAIERNRHPLDKFLVDISPSTNTILDAPKTEDSSSSSSNADSDFSVLSSSSAVSYSFEGDLMKPTNGDDSSSLKCSSVVRYSKPLRALNTAGQWKIIVNVEFAASGANYTQTVRIEECSHKDGLLATCGGETISACLQQFKLYRLLAWDVDKGFYIDAFLLPTSCFCGSRHSSH